MLLAARGEPNDEKERVGRVLPLVHPKSNLSNYLYLLSDRIA